MTRRLVLICREWLWESTDIQPVFPNIPDCCIPSVVAVDSGGARVWWQMLQVHALCSIIDRMALLHCLCKPGCMRLCRRAWSGLTAPAPHHTDRTRGSYCCRKSILGSWHSPAMHPGAAGSRSQLVADQLVPTHLPPTSVKRASHHNRSMRTLAFSNCGGYQRCGSFSGREGCGHVGSVGSASCTGMLMSQWFTGMQCAR